MLKYWGGLDLRMYKHMVPFFKVKPCRNTHISGQWCRFCALSMIYILCKRYQRIIYNNVSWFFSGSMSEKNYWQCKYVPYHTPNGMIWNDKFHKSSIRYKFIGLSQYREKHRCITHILQSHTYFPCQNFSNWPQKLGPGTKYYLKQFFLSVNQTPKNELRLHLYYFFGKCLLQDPSHFSWFKWVKRRGEVWVGICGDIDRIFTNSFKIVTAL